MCQSRRPGGPDPHHPGRPSACSAGRPSATHEDRCRPAFLGQERGRGDRRCGAVGHELTVCRRAAGVHHALGIRSWSKWVTFSRSGNPPAATAPRASLHRVVGGRQSHPPRPWSVTPRLGCADRRRSRPGPGRVGQWGSGPSVRLDPDGVSGASILLGHDRVWGPGTRGTLRPHLTRIRPPTPDGRSGLTAAAARNRDPHGFCTMYRRRRMASRRVSRRAGAAGAAHRSAPGRRPAERS